MTTTLLTMAEWLALPVEERAPYIAGLTDEQKREATRLWRAEWDRALAVLAAAAGVDEER